MVEFKPEGYHTVTPYISIAGAAAFIDYCSAAFGAKEAERFAAADGSVLHSEIRLSDSVIMLTDASEMMAAQPANFYVYVEDVDATHKQAVAAGGTSTEEPNDKFYGDRTSTVTDPFGNMWFLATHVEDVSAEEMAKRAEQYVAKG